MKSLITTILIMAFASLLIAQDEHKPAASTPEFDKMKTLVGDWKHTDTSGTTYNISYKLVSNGSVLMETINGGSHTDDMITMYHLNGTKLMLTHYCSMGNQPRMRMTKASKDGNSLTFSYIDGTSIANPKKDGYMSGLVVTFKDADHFTSQWWMTQDGKKSGPMTFELERVK